ncbi:SET domain-containing protein-lysine N-methyltransferase [Patescibacteria group bacterium]|nr:SET domain-containing protein-lysine N-methyltransferase [Patescibacteria group bacterium]
MGKGPVVINASKTGSNKTFGLSGAGTLTYVSKGDLGKGLFARRKIRAGTMICRFSGPMISFAEAASKGEKECYPLQIDDNKYIDLDPPGCFANHSCEPNAGIRADLELVALTDIPAGTEIRYDYSTTMDEDYFTMPCRCGSESCRGKVEDFKLLPPSASKRYLTLGIVMSFIVRKYNVKP